MVRNNVLDNCNCITMASPASASAAVTQAATPPLPDTAALDARHKSVFVVGPSAIGAYFTFACQRRLHLEASSKAYSTFAARWVPTTTTTTASSSTSTKTSTKPKLSPLHNAIVQRGFAWERELNTLLVSPPYSAKLKDVEALAASSSDRLALSLQLLHSDPVNTVIYQARHPPHPHIPPQHAISRATLSQPHLVAPDAWQASLGWRPLAADGTTPQFPVAFSVTKPDYVWITNHATRGRELLVIDAKVLHSLHNNMCVCGPDRPPCTQASAHTKLTHKIQVTKNAAHTPPPHAHASPLCACVCYNRWQCTA